jgi:uncharacterized protein (DUF362 family)
MGLNRRNFLQGLAALPLAGSAGGTKSRVVIARDPDVVKLLDRAMQSFYNCDQPVAAWKRVVRPGEVVGLKVNCLAGRGISTNVHLVEAVCERLQQAGVPKKNIVIWDRLNADLERAGFRLESNADRIRSIGNDTLGYQQELEISGSAGSLLCRTLTEVCDAVINLPVLKDHGIVGVTMALKNLFGAIHNPNKYHINAGDPYVADVFAMPPIRKKVRLTICDAITAQYEGGPSFMPQWTWPYNGLLVSEDPVALDYTGWHIIERKRGEKGLRALQDLKRGPSYIATAARAKLGTNDPRQIEVVEV